MACIKAADVGHPTKPFKIHSVWSNLITLEFFVQGDLEKEYGLTPHSFMDRNQAGPGTLEGHGHFINIICELESERGRERRGKRGRGKI